MAADLAPSTPLAAPGTVPNRRCRNCGALLRFTPPPPSRWAPSTWIHLAWQRWYTRVPVVLILGAGSMLLMRHDPRWLMLLAPVAFLAWLIKPPGYRPRCPRCRSTDVEAIAVEALSEPAP